MPSEIKVTEPLEKDLEQRLIKAQEDIGKDADATFDQREKASDDMHFLNSPGGMWRGFKDEEQERARMQFDMVSGHINKFQGDWINNRVNVEFKPDDEGTSDDDAELQSGIYRADFRDGSGDMAVDQAVHELSHTGYGCYKITTRFEDDSDAENDRQRVEFAPLYSSYNLVVWHDAAKRPDKRDALRCTVLTPTTRASFEEQYPDKQPVSAYTPDTDFHSNSWFSSRNIKDDIYIATRYDIVRKKEKVFIYNNLATSKKEIWSKEDHDDIKDELAADEFREFVRERTIIKQSVWKSVFSGDEYLDMPRRIAGKYIPIIPMYAYRSYIDGVEWYKGFVRPLKDPARLWNMLLNQMAEQSASSGTGTPMFDPDQMSEEYEDQWADRGTPKSWLPVDSIKDGDGNVTHTGPVGILEAARLDPSITALTTFLPEMFKEMTGSTPQDTLDPNASGKAINAILKRENLGTVSVMNNIAKALEWGGEVYTWIASEIYNESRMMRLIGKDGSISQKRIMGTVIDEETGELKTANDITKKRFKTYADVGPQYETQNEETVENLKGMAEMMKDTQIGQQFMPVIISMMIEKMPGVGLGPLRDMARKHMLVQDVIKPETDEEKQFVQQLKQQQGRDQGDEQKQFLAAVTEQASAQAQEAMASARQKDSDSIDNLASAGKKAAETAKIQSETETGKLSNIIDIRKRIFDQARGLPIESAG